MPSGGAPASRTARGLEEVADPGPALEGLVRGIRDDRAVHERVAVGNADLDDVDAGLDHRHHGLDGARHVRETDGEVADERCPALIAAALEHGSDACAHWVLPSSSMSPK